MVQEDSSSIIEETRPINIQTLDVRARRKKIWQIIQVPLPLFIFTLLLIGLNLWLDTIIAPQFVGTEYRDKNCTDVYGGLITSLDHVTIDQWVMKVTIYLYGQPYESYPYTFTLTDHEYNELQPVVGAMIPIYVECNAFNDHYNTIYSLTPTRMKNTATTQTIMTLTFMMCWVPVIVLGSLAISFLSCYMRDRI